MKYVAGLFLFAALSLVFAFGQEPEDPYEKGLQLTREQGAEAGVSYFRELASAKKDPLVINLESGPPFCAMWNVIKHMARSRKSN